MNFTKLTCATRLLLVTVFCMSTLCYGLAIRDARLKILNLNLVYILQAPLESAQMELTLSPDDGLAQFL